MLRTLFCEQYGHAALFAPDRAPRPDSSLLPSYLYHTLKTAPALPRPCAASALPPPRREPRQPPPRADGPRSRGKTNPTVKWPRADSTWARGWVSSSEDCSSHPLSSWHRLPQPEQRRSRVFFSPLFEVYRCLSGGLQPEKTPRAPSASPTAAGEAATGGKPPRARGSPSLT